jgi:DNA-binding NarL/FixJ family response regulator
MLLSSRKARVAGPRVVCRRHASFADRVSESPGARRILDDEDDIQVVAEAGDGEEAVARAAELLPDVVVMDMRMPVVNGIEATRRIVVDECAPRVLALTTFDLDEYV